MTRRFAWAWGALAVVAAAGSAAADPSLWGSTGLLSVPTAQVQPYASFAIGANWVDEPNTHVTMTGYILSLLEAFKVRWNLITGAYKRWDRREREHAPSEVKQNV